ncbi:MAG TPA: ATP-binding protein, partial [Planctomycetota bacterium]|nr:ATP-binding protein [Planctomycetota bacterium]
ELAAGSPQQQHLQVIETSVHAAADLCRQMLTCAGIGPLATGPVDLNKIVGDGIDLVRGSLGPGVQVQTRLAAAPVASRGDPGQLAQVVMNLLLNAAEALPDGNGTVTVATGTMPVTAARLATMVGTPTLPAGDYAFLEVTDTGAGMSAATQARIFEPFFSTKSLGRGLGLPGVLGIVRRHGGAIRVDSVPGTGTMIRALLPQAEPPPAARAT